MNPNTTYYYRVCGINAAGEGNYAYAEASTSPPPPPPPPVTEPGAPSNLTATAQEFGKIYLSWNAGSGATSYLIQRSSSTSSTWVSLATPSSTSYTDTSVTVGVKYNYVVYAVNSAGSSSGYAGIASATGAHPIVGAWVHDNWSPIIFKADGTMDDDGGGLNFVWQATGTNEVTVYYTYIGGPIYGRITYTFSSNYGTLTVTNYTAAMPEGVYYRQ